MTRYGLCAHLAEGPGVLIEGWEWESHATGMCVAVHSGTGERVGIREDGERVRDLPRRETAERVRKR